MPSTIAIDQLRVGMFVHLDGGWLSHPFPLSAFRISSAEQITVLRRLGLREVRWSPERSETATVDTGAPADAASTAADTVADSAAAARHHAALQAQREVQRQCEQQFAEAAAAWRRACDSVGALPAKAHEAAAALATAMVSKLAEGGEVGIRLLPGSGGDRAAAHALNVTVISMLLGRALGMARDELFDLSLGALLHDMGKLDLPERVRQLDPAFSAAELNAYRDHVARGVNAGRRLALPEGALTVIAQHHEHADASGFPQRIGGDRIALASRIVTIVNRYDNLCNPAVRAPVYTPHEAVAMLFAHGRGRYDASVLNAFIRMMGVYPAGSLVQLTDDRFAMVISVNSSRPLKPSVLVHDPRVARAEALLLNLEAQPDLGIRRSLPAAKMPADALQYLDPRPRVAYFFEPMAEAGVEPARIG